MNTTNLIKILTPGWEVSFSSSTENNALIQGYESDGARIHHNLVLAAIQQNNLTLQLESSSLKIDNKIELTTIQQKQNAKRPQSSKLSEIFDRIFLKNTFNCSTYQEYVRKCDVLDEESEMKEFDMRCPIDKICRNKNLTSMIEGIFNKLISVSAVSNLKDWKFEIRVTQENSNVAISGPSKVSISTAVINRIFNLIRYYDSNDYDIKGVKLEDVLAFILAHEIVHIESEDALRLRSMGVYISFYLKKIIDFPLFFTSDERRERIADDSAYLFLKSRIFERWQQNKEFNADKYAIELLYRANYNIYGAEFYMAWGEQGEPTYSNSFFRLTLNEHPPKQKRLEKIVEIIRRIKEVGIEKAFQ